MKAPRITPTFISLVGAAAFGVLMASDQHANWQDRQTQTELDALLAAGDLCTTPDSRPAQSMLPSNNPGPFDQATLCGDAGALYAAQSDCYGLYAKTLTDFVSAEADPFLALESYEALEEHFTAMGASQITIEPEKSRIRAIWLNEQGQRHNEDGPAVITVTPGKSYAAVYMQNGIFERAGDLPSYVKFEPGVEAHGQWNNALGNHNLYGPAYASVKLDTRTLELRWWLDGAPAALDLAHGFTEAHVNLDTNIAYERKAETLVGVGMRHRHQDDSLHIIRLDPDTGQERERIYMFHDDNIYGDEYREFVTTSPDGAISTRWEHDGMVIPTPSEEEVQRLRAASNKHHRAEENIMPGQPENAPGPP